MPFEFKPEMKGPKEYGGSPAKALMDEISQFAKQRRRYNLRRYAGLEKDEPEEPATEEPATHDPETCEACRKGECDDPEHLGEEDKSAMVIMLGGKE